MNHNNIIIFAFRYGLERRTGAPLMIASYIKANIDVLNSNDIKSILDEIDLYHKGEISEDWLDLREWLNNYIDKKGIDL